MEIMDVTYELGMFTRLGTSNSMAKLRVFSLLRTSHVYFNTKHNFFLGGWGLEESTIMNEENIYFGTGCSRRDIHRYRGECFNLLPLPNIAVGARHFLL